MTAASLALKDLRQTRRKNRLADIHWIDALYRVYMIGAGSLILLGLAISRLPTNRLTVDEAKDFANVAPGWLGLGFALAVAIGLRSGGRGGPLVLEAPVVMHEMNAPVPRHDVVAGPAVKQLRFLAYLGALVGGILGATAVQRIDANLIVAVICCAVAFSAAAVTSSAVAMMVSGRRVKWWAANFFAVIVLGWSVADALLHVKTSPLTMMATVAFWPITFSPLGFALIAVVGLTIWLAFRRIGDISLESAMRRAGLVSQLRFAATLQDVRTVVLLRRQLSQERPRAKPWIRLRRGKQKAFIPAVWKRDWQSYLRFPLTRIARMIALAVIAGLSLGFLWRGTIPAIFVAAFALFIAAYDASEPTAQEVDHPTRWESLPDAPGVILLRHFSSAFAVMLILCLIAAASAMLLVPPKVVLDLMIIVVPTALATTAGATISTAQGAPDAVKLVGLGPEILGVFMAVRLIFPPALAVLGLLPLLVAGSDPDNIKTTAVSNMTVWAIFAAGFSILYLRTRKPKHI